MKCLKYGMFSVKRGLEEEVLTIHSNDASTINYVVKEIEQIYPIRKQDTHGAGFTHSIYLKAKNSFLSSTNPYIEAYNLATSCLLQLGWEPYQNENTEYIVGINFKKCLAYEN